MPDLLQKSQHWFGKVDLQLQVFLMGSSTHLTEMLGCRHLQLTL